MGSTLHYRLSCPLFPYMEVLGSLICMAKFPWAGHGQLPFFHGSPWSDIIMSLKVSGQLLLMCSPWADAIMYLPKKWAAPVYWAAHCISGMACIDKSPCSCGLWLRLCSYFSYFRLLQYMQTLRRRIQPWCTGIVLEKKRKFFSSILNLFTVLGSIMIGPFVILNEVQNAMFCIRLRVSHPSHYFRRLSANQSFEPKCGFIGARVLLLS